MSRFIVTELRGYLGEMGGRVAATGRVPGVSYQVLDTAWNHRLLRIWRTEDYKNRGDRARLTAEETARGRAEEYAADLNAGRTPNRNHRVRYRDASR